MEAIAFRLQDRPEAYGWVEQTLRELGYLKADRETKGLVRQYLQKMTGYALP